MLYCINLLLYLLQLTRPSQWNFYLSKNHEITDIDSHENIDLLQNDKNFETLYLPK